MNPVPTPALQEAAYRDSTLYCMLRAKRPYEEIMIQLVEEKHAALKKIMELESLAPKKIRHPDGNISVWHCPDELIPETTNFETSCPTVITP